MIFILKHLNKFKARVFKIKLILLWKYSNVVVVIIINVLKIQFSKTDDNIKTKKTWYIFIHKWYYLPNIMNKMN